MGIITIHPTQDWIGKYKALGWLAFLYDSIDILTPKCNPGLDRDLGLIGVSSVIIDPFRHDLHDFRSFYPRFSSVLLVFLLR